MAWPEWLSSWVFEKWLRWIPKLSAAVLPFRGDKEAALDGK
jgi:hypothetical protein